MRKRKQKGLKVLNLALLFVVFKRRHGSEGVTDDKAGALLFYSSSSLKPASISLPDSITLGSQNFPFSDSARNLKLILDWKLSLKKHVINICQTAYFELKRRFLIEDLAKRLNWYFLYAITAWLLQLSPYGYT